MPAIGGLSVVLYIHVCSVLANHDLVLLLNLFT